MGMIKYHKLYFSSDIVRVIKLRKGAGMFYVWNKQKNIPFCWKNLWKLAYFKELSRYLSDETEEKTVNICSRSRDLKPVPHDYESGLLTTR